MNKPKEILITSDDVTIEKYINRRHRFSLPFEITEDMAIRIQKNFGYHPAGYGFNEFTSSETGSSWSCSDSCD